MDTNEITVKDIVTAVNGTLLRGDADIVIDRICTDSRDIYPKNEEADGMTYQNGLFVPIIGARSDAHDFISQSIRNGVSAVLTSRHKTSDEVNEIVETDKLPAETAWIAVQDTMKALEQIGFLFRSRIHFPFIVGVTGSVGKTTTREMIAHLLASEHNVYKTIRNYNSRVGVPIMMSMIRNHYEDIVLELGMNVPGELTDISRMARPDLGVITNVGVAHIEFYDTQDNIALQKLSVCEGVSADGAMILNGNDSYLMKHCGVVPQKKILYGTDPEFDYYATDIVSDENGSRFVLHIKKNGPEWKKECTLTVPGKHNVMNALAAFAVCDYRGLDIERCVNALPSFKGFMNRLDISMNSQGICVIDDTYNASPTSMKAGLDVLCDRTCKGKRIAVLGDMFELGSFAPKYHYEVGEYAAGTETDLVICVGENAVQIAKAISDNTDSTVKAMVLPFDQVSSFLKENANEGDIVYFKASNGMKFKALAQELKQL